ncbi:uncharacterized protein V1510DRAFT_358443 [Dipodascopsis tothii]|uniref:uncharacterized protein n=1 Tax=Dipodascopsis tothii TaxID=44089 RepID=UPI0034CEA988
MYTNLTRALGRTGVRSAAVGSGARAFTASAAAQKALKVGYVPEHFSTPLFFAQSEGYYAEAGVEPTMVPYISGTGHMIEALKAKDIDVAVGLTEGFVAGLGRGLDFYKIVGTYVRSPLRWAISAGANRADMQSRADLRGAKIGISRIGSGSYVMPFVLALQEGWSEPFDFKVLTNFKNLRDGVNDGTADAFMWEIFTSKRYYDSGEIKQIGIIDTPWPSWTITAHADVVAAERGTLGGFLGAVNRGVAHFKANPDKAVDYIAANLDYTAEDARAWLATVDFVDDVSTVDMESTIERTVAVLKTAGVITDSAFSATAAVDKIEV